MKKKEQELVSPSPASWEEPEDWDSLIPGKDLGDKREILDKQVASSLEFSIRYLTDIPSNFRPVEVLKASIKGHRLVVSVQTSMWLPEPIGDSGELLGTRKQSTEFRREFEKHLKRKMSTENRRTLSNILYAEFDAFVRTIICVRNPNVMRHVRKTTARRGAGRPRTNLDPDTVASLKARSEVIRQALHKVRNEIRKWRLEDDEQCKGRIRKTYSDRFDWIPMFLENKWGNHTTTRKGYRKTVRISDLTSWSAAYRADLIALEEHRLRTQQSVSLSKFRHMKSELRQSRITVF